MENYSSIGKIEYKQADKLQKTNATNPFGQEKSNEKSIFLTKQTATSAQKYASDPISSAEAKYIAEQMEKEKNWFSKFTDKISKSIKKEKTSSENIKSDDEQEELSAETNANSDTSGEAFDAE
ncbi:hypothetical protein IKA15_04830 [bacterium]|nr:hypothetical protein [bacterium]